MSFYETYDRDYTGVKEQNQKNRFRQRREYRFFRCPQCSVTTRVPRGKGKIRIICPRCGNSFVRRT